MDFLWESFDLSETSTSPPRLTRSSLKSVEGKTVSIVNYIFLLTASQPNRNGFGNAIKKSSPPGSFLSEECDQHADLLSKDSLGFHFVSKMMTLISVQLSSFNSDINDKNAIPKDSVYYYQLDQFDCISLAAKQLGGASCRFDDFFSWDRIIPFSILMKKLLPTELVLQSSRSGPLTLMVERVITNKQEQQTGSNLTRNSLGFEAPIIATSDKHVGTVQFEPMFLFVFFN